MNVFTCTTRLYQDAEQRFTSGGDPIVSFKGAVDAGFGQNKTTSWIQFNLWGKRGESLTQYLKDKTQVCVSGELANREYTDKDGQKRYSLEVRVNELTLLGGKPEGQQQAAPQRQAPSQAPQQAGGMDMDDDIPFMRHADGAAWRAI